MNAMNNDLIERKDVINKILERIDRYTELSYANGSGMKHRRTAMREFLKDLKDIPPADSCEDTISRAFVLAELSDLADEFSETDENGLHNDRWCGIMDSLGAVSKAPFILSNRFAAEWIMSDDGIICSKCKEYPAFIDSYEFPIPVMEWHSDFCPNCGARMKGADDA